jgi:hypothetical protein
VRAGARALPGIAACAALVVAVTSHAWLVNSARELHGGLLSFDSGGEAWSNSELVAAALANGSQQGSRWFAPAGQLTFALALLAAATLLASLVASSRWISRAAIALLALSLASASVFLGTKPTGPAFGLAPGWSALVFVVGAAAGALARARGAGMIQARGRSPIT